MDRYTVRNFSRLLPALPICLIICSTSSRASPNDGGWARVPSPSNREGHAAVYGAGVAPRSMPPTARLGASPAARATQGDGTWNDFFPPQGRASHTAVYDPLRDRMLVLGGSFGTPSDGPWPFEVWALSLSADPVWSQIMPTGTPPAGRYGHSTIYDPVRDRVVVFGGSTGGWPVKEVWELSLANGPEWHEIHPAGTLPVERMEHAAIYDPARDRMIIFGGYHPYGFRNDVWALALGTSEAWAEITPTGIPPAGRYGHVAINDALRDRLVVFGGYGSQTSRQETWTLSLAGNPIWSLLAPSGTPHGAGVSPTAIYDPRGDRMLVFGGSDGNGFFQSSTVSALALAGAAWDTIAAGGSRPLPRAIHASTYDPVRERMIVFGGVAGHTFRDDLWSLSLAETPIWTVLGPPGGAPSGRARATATHDPVRERMLVFGGWDGESYLNDVWAFSLSDPSWSELNVLGPRPPGRFGHAAVYDPVRERLLVLGGAEYGAGYQNDVWALAFIGGPTWSILNPVGEPPSARLYHTAVYDPVRDRVLVFGGYDGRDLFGDLWELSLADPPAWNLITAAGPSPSPRGAHTAVYDPVRDRMLVFGGWDGTRYSNQVWELSFTGGPTWSLSSAVGIVPTGRATHVAAYDEGRDRMIVFGGFDSISVANGGDLNEVLALSFAGTPSWSLVSPAGLPPIDRRYSAGIYDPAHSRMVVFGGIHSYNMFLDDVWALDWDVPVATLIALVSAEPQFDGVELVWFGAEAPRLSAEVERRAENTEWQHLAMITGDGQGMLRFRDRSVTSGGRYAYRLTYRWDGDLLSTPEHWVNIPVAKFAVHGLRTNPAVKGLVVSISLPSDMPATIEVFDVAGRRVHSQSITGLGPGTHDVPLEGGPRFSSGIYLLRLTQEWRVSTARGAIVR